MKIESIEIRNFRNINQLQLSLRPGLNVFQGLNGHGKTNFLEAVHLLIQNRSFRYQEQDSWLGQGKGLKGLSLKGVVEHRGLKHSLGLEIFLKKTGGLEKKRTHNLKTQKRKLYPMGPSRSNRGPKGSSIPHMPIVLFSPESLQIIKELGQKRRDLVDQLCLGMDPRFRTTFLECKKLLKQKNQILKQIKEKKGNLKSLRDVMEALNSIFFQKASQWSHCRLQTLERITPFFQREFQKIMGSLHGTPSIDYQISKKSFLGCSKKDIFNAMCRRWEELKVREEILGQSLVGPHRHGIEFFLSGRSARTYASQGEQRALILAFKMAQIVLHMETFETCPILMLDDVLSELDSLKKQGFVRELMETKCQIFLTSTDREGVFLEKCSGGLVVDVFQGVLSPRPPDVNLLGKNPKRESRGILESV